MLPRLALVLVALLLPLAAAGSLFQPTIVAGSQKISDTAGDLSDPNNPGTNPAGYLDDNG